MRIHHLNCSTFCPFGGHLFDRVTSGFGPAKTVCHCLLIETEQGLVLIDTGLGLQDIRHANKRLDPFMRLLLRPKLDVNETALVQIKKMGFSPSDVRHIVLTHLDFDHAGGIDDFPHAQVHVMDAELKAATHPKGIITQRRYSQAQLSHSKTWNTYWAEGEKWFGFDAVRELKGLPPEILMIPLVGHTEGHAGIAVETDDGWLLHAGDAYFFRGEIHQDYSCTIGLRSYQKLMEVNRRMRLLNQLRLRDLAKDHFEDVRIFCAHDTVEFEELKDEEMKLFAGGSQDYKNVLWLRPSTQEGRALH